MAYGSIKRISFPNRITELDRFLVFLLLKNPLVKGYFERIWIFLGFEGEIKRDDYKGKEYYTIGENQ